MTFKEPSDYVNKFNQLYTQFTQIVNDMKNMYISYRLGGNNNYNNKIIQLNNIRADIFITREELFSQTGEIEKRVNRLNFLISELNAQNNKLEKKLEKFKDTGLAAEGELKIQKTMFKELFTQNIVLIIAILFILKSLFSNFKNT